ncbi:hypothetical protein Tco_0181298, partial [Tanacetum coccineum]
MSPGGSTMASCEDVDSFCDNRGLR